MLSDRGTSAHPTNIEPRYFLHWDLNYNPQPVRSSRAINCLSQNVLDTSLGSLQYRTGRIFNTAPREETEPALSGGLVQFHAIPGFAVLVHPPR